MFSLFHSQVNSFSKTIVYANFFSWYILSTQAVALSGYSPTLLVFIGVLKNLQIKFAEILFLPDLYLNIDR
jgi:hypothetical protein